MSGHVFISYSHQSDSRYVERLAIFLARAGIQTWFDREIVSGDRWEEILKHQIETSSAVLVIMSTTSGSSVWVNRELALAQSLQLPIFPLLLSGEPFFRLLDVQFEKVHNGR